METSTGRPESGRTVRRDKTHRDRGPSRWMRSLTRFVGQILDELRKVVRPTGSELVNYTVVVIVFVLIIMAIVAALDFAFTRLMLFVLAG